MDIILLHYKCNIPELYNNGKVDLEIAMAALDKLLRSNELNFAFLAVIPSVLILYGGYRVVTSISRRLSGFSKRRAYQKLRISLRYICTHRLSLIFALLYPVHYIVYFVHDVLSILLNEACID